LLQLALADVLPGQVIAERVQAGPQRGRDALSEPGGRAESRVRPEVYPNAGRAGRGDGGPLRPVRGRRRGLLARLVRLDRQALGLVLEEERSGDPVQLLKLPSFVRVRRRIERDGVHHRRAFNDRKPGEEALVGDAHVKPENDDAASIDNRRVNAQPVLTLGDGRYPLFTWIGEGNFGEVYAGTDEHLGVPVAVKLFKAEVAFDAVLLEAQVQAGLRNHEHVVAVRNVVELPRPYVVMDYYPAGSVADCIDAGAVSLIDAVQWTRDGLAGLAHVHANGVIHRDIKPGNWLLTEGGRVAVSDFGLAEDTVRQIRAARGICYMPHLAPEVEAQGTSAASDLWATGCTLYRLLTGEYPFEDEQAANAGLFVPPHKLNPQVPLSLSRVVAKALETDPQRRYDDAWAMHGDLVNCGIAYSWTEADEPDTLETWLASTPAADYRITLVERPRAGLELVASKDSGAGFRRVRRDRPPSLKRAGQVRRGWLLDIVLGRGL
jgi:hypothetical protein